MPDIGRLEQISQGSIHISSVDASTVRPASVETVIIDYPLRYNGAYTFTPSSEPQTIRTAEKLLGYDITINPIPSNYGRIDWNGQTLQII